MDESIADPALQLGAWVAEGRDQLPPPGSGRTLARWRVLAAAGGLDLGFAKLFEGHTDALAILHELGGPVPAPGSTWSTWAAEPPDGRVLFEEAAGGEVVLHGCKRWCSGAESVSHGLLTVWTADGNGPWLAAVDMRSPRIATDGAAWRAVGMAASRSVDVVFDGVPAKLVGRRGEYLSRPGFWQGGAGVAACWFGAACALAGWLRRASAKVRDEAAVFRFAALGEVDVALSRTAALLRECAGWIDAHPRDDAQAVALRARLAVEAAVETVMRSTGRSLGAGPYCHDARFARLAADLPVFMRQSHAELDLMALGRLAAPLDDSALPWSL